MTTQLRSAAADRAEQGSAASEFLSRMFPPPRPFSVRVGLAEALPATETPCFALVFSSAAALRRAFTPPMEQNLGNAYISGAIDVEGDLVAAYGAVLAAGGRITRSMSEVAALYRAWRTLPRGELAVAMTAPAELRGRRHTAARDQAAVRHHYDLGNDFYALFLDRRMIYSCAYFPSGNEDLDTAQELKLEHICRKLRLRSGERLLDVGCGWGGLLIHAVTRHGVSGVGITLSEQQHRLARQRVADLGLSDRIEIRLADYRTLGGESFDKAASVGMFEHVGEARLPEYFRRIHGVLRPGGLFLNHGLSRRAGTRPSRLRGWLTAPLRQMLMGQSQLTRAVFPDTELIPLSEVNTVAEHAGWEVRDVEAWREHYATTLRHWVERLEARRDDAVRLAGEGTVRAWRLYFAASAYRFDVGLINVNQTLLAKPLADGTVDLPPSRADLYR